MSPAHEGEIPITTAPSVDNPGWTDRGARCPECGVQFGRSVQRSLQGPELERFDIRLRKAVERHRAEAHGAIRR